MVNRILLLSLSFLILLKVVALYYTNFDLFGDEAQYWLWSKNLDYGYFSKPPLLPWVLNIYTILFGETFFSLKIFPSIIYFFSAWAFYTLGKNIGLEKQRALFCSFSFLLMPAVSISTFIVSTDVLLLLFWILSLNELVKLISHPSIRGFILLGIFIGLACLAKYAGIYFVICLVLYILFDKKFRLFSYKNYLGFCICLICTTIIILPNLIWNLNNNWITMQHTSDNANFKNISISVVRGIEFLAIQALMIGPFLFVSGMLGLKKIKINNSQKFLLIFSLPIFIIVVLEAVMVRANANWAAPALISFFLFLSIMEKNNFLIRLNLIFNFIFCLVFFILISTSYPLKMFDRINGLSEFYKQIYLERSEPKTVDIVVGDRMMFANMKFILRKEKIKFHMPYQSGSKVTNHFQLSSPLEKGMSDNFVYIGSPNDITYLKNKHTLQKKIVPTYKFTNKTIEVYEVTFN